jgi:hypothetical protein
MLNYPYIEWNSGSLLLIFDRQVSICWLTSWYILNYMKFPSKTENPNESYKRIPFWYGVYKTILVVMQLVLGVITKQIPQWRRAIMRMLWYINVGCAWYFLLAAVGFLLGWMVNLIREPSLRTPDQFIMLVIMWGIVGLVVPEFKEDHWRHPPS